MCKICLNIFIILITQKVHSSTRMWLTWSFFPEIFVTVWITDIFAGSLRVFPWHCKDRVKCSNTEFSTEKAYRNICAWGFIRLIFFDFLKSLYNIIWGFESAWESNLKGRPTASFKVYQVCPCKKQNTNAIIRFRLTQGKVSGSSILASYK